MEIELHVDSVLLAEPDGMIEMFEDVLLELGPIAAIGPAAIIKGQSDEVEPQLGDPGKVLLSEWPAACNLKHLEQIEASPPRQLPCRGFGQCGPGFSGMG